MKSNQNEEDFDCGEFTTLNYDTNIRQFIRYHIDDDSEIDQSIVQKINSMNIESPYVDVNIKKLPKDSKQLFPKLNELECMTFSPRLKFVQDVTETSINLSNMHLNILPDKIMKYKDTLMQINLSRNKFYYIPIELISFKNLKVLKLNHNHIKFLPNEFINLTSLEILNLGYNQLQNLPSDFSKLSKNLKHLNIEYNHIETISKEITDLNNLHVLNISHNSLKSFPTMFKDMIKLEELSFEWFKYNIPPGTLTQTTHTKKSLLTKLKDVCEDLYKKKILTINFSEFITYMCKITVNFETRYGDNRTILHIASNSEDFSVIDHVILKHPQLIDQQDTFKHTALSYCLLYNKLKSAKFLLQKGANPLLGGGNFGSTLHIAVEKLNIFFTKTILKFGEKVDILDLDDNTSLHLVMSKMNDEFKKASRICNILLENGANPNLKNNNNLCPIHIVTRRRDHQTISWIAKYNHDNKNKVDTSKLFDLDKKGGPYRWTPMHIAAYTESSHVAEALGEANVDMFKRGSNGHTAKKLVGVGSLTMKIIEKYERKWLIKNVLNRKIKKRPTHKRVFSSSILKDVKICTGRLTKIDSLLNTDVSTNIGNHSRNASIFAMKSFAVKLGKQDTLLKTISYIESKNFQESSEIAPETETVNTTYDVIPESDIPQENTSIEEVKEDEKKIDDMTVTENNFCLKFTMRESGRMSLNDDITWNQRDDGLYGNGNTERYDDFLKDELRNNYQTFKSEANILKENLISELTIFSDKLKIFGMFKVLNNHVLDYIYTYCNLEVNKRYHGIIYHNEKLALTKQGTIHKNTLVYMNHYYDLIPNAIMATYVSLQIDKAETRVLKTQLILLLGDLNYFPGIQFLTEIIKISSLNRFIYDEAINTLNYLQITLSVKLCEKVEQNKKRNESIKIIEKKVISSSSRRSTPKRLLESQKNIFLASKKIKEKTFN